MEKESENREESAITTIKPTSILLVDDHDIVREGLRLMFEKETDLEIVGEVASGSEAIENFKKLRPDVVLLDIKLPDIDGFQVAEEIRKEAPDIPLIMLTGYDSELYLADAMRTRVNGFLSKESSRKVVTQSVRLVREGVSVWDTRVLNKAISSTSYPANIPGERNKSSLEQLLTDKELVILRSLGKGFSNKEISTKTGCSTETVKKYIYRCMKKFGVSSRTQALLVAIREGLIDPLDTKS